ncbi:MAG: insulinase family protein [Clostridia bacterium]|nr:insulinase family protein [Clostridia bacterium]
MAKIIPHENALLGDTYYEVLHDTGLTILVYPKPGYSTSYAVIGTNYGSIDDALKVRGGEEEQLPWGTAHFLEHKLFESEELDAFERFAETGASANAYTSFDRTCYLFSCSSHFKENLEILLDFVQHPYFTEATVQKEQGIIGQEIRMYLDDPGWQVLFNLLKALYVGHPVRVDIAGTEESISHITADLLYRCYENFYNLHNMALAVAGNVTVEEVLAICDSSLREDPEVFVERPDKGEPKEIVRPVADQEFAVTIPTFALGFKETHDTPIRSTKERLLTDILMDIIGGETSALYERLLREGLIDTGFGYEYFTGPGYATVIFEGRSRDPEAVAEAIKEEIRVLRRDGVDPAEFNRLRKMNYGKAVMSYNDIDGLANGLVGAYLNGAELFEELDLYRELTVEDANEQLARQFLEEYSALSVVHGPSQAV